MTLGFIYTVLGVKVTLSKLINKDEMDKYVDERMKEEKAETSDEACRADIIADWVAEKTDELRWKLLSEVLGLDPEAFPDVHIFLRTHDQEEVDPEMKEFEEDPLKRPIYIGIVVAKTLCSRVSQFWCNPEIKVWADAGEAVRTMERNLPDMIKALHLDATKLEFITVQDDCVCCS